MVRTGKYTASCKQTSSNEGDMEANPSQGIEVALSGEAGIGLEAKKKKKGDDENPEEEEKDYWEDVKFGEDNFEEVENFVQTNYIDPETPEYRSRAEACNFAVLGLNTRTPCCRRTFTRRERTILTKGLWTAPLRLFGVGKTWCS